MNMFKFPGIGKVNKLRRTTICKKLISTNMFCKEDIVKRQMTKLADKADFAKED